MNGIDTLAHTHARGGGLTQGLGITRAGGVAHPRANAFAHAQSTCVHRHAHTRPTEATPKPHTCALTFTVMNWIWDQYLPDPTAGLQWKASPLRAETLKGACPAFIASATHDVLRDEAELYAQKLREAGVSVRLRLPQFCSFGGHWRCAVCKVMR